MAITSEEFSTIGYLNPEQDAALQQAHEFLLSQDSLPPEERANLATIQAANETLRKAKLAGDGGANDAFDANIIQTPMEGRKAPAPRISHATGMLVNRNQQEYEMSNNDFAAHNRAAEAGVDISTGLSSSIRAKASLVDFDPEMEALVINDELQKMYKAAGIVVPPDRPLTFIDENTGKPSFYRIDDNGQYRPTLIDPSGIDTGDFADMVGSGISMAAEMQGSIAGFAGGGVPGAALGAFGGGAFGVQLRRMIGLQLGLPEEALAGLDLERSLKEGAISGASEFVLPGFGALYKKYMNRARFLDPNDTAKIQRNLEEAQADMQKIVELGEDRGLNLSLAESTTDPVIGAKTAAQKASAAGREAEEFVTQDYRNQQALNQHLGDIFDAEGVGAPTTASEVISVQAKDEVTREARESGKLIDDATDTLESARQVLLDNKPTSSHFEQYRAGLQGADEEARAIEETFWGTFRDLVGYSDETKKSIIQLANEDSSPVRRAIRSIYNESQQSISDKTLKTNTNTIENLGFFPEKNSLQTARQVLEGTLSGSTLDPAQLHRAVSELKAEARSLAAGTSTTDWNAATIKKLINAIDEQITTGKYVDSSTGKVVAGEQADLIKLAYGSAKDATLNRVRIYEQKGISKLLETHIGPNGDEYYNIDPEKLRKALFKAGDTEALSRVMGAMTVDPKMQGQLLNELEAMYAEKVMKKGYNPDAHRKFMAQYREHFNMLAPEGTVPDSIVNGKQLVESLNKARERQKQIIKSTEELYGSGVTAYNASSITGALFDRGKTTVEQADKYLRRIASLDPKMYRAIQSEGREFIENTVKSSGAVNPDSLRDMIIEHGGMLGVLYGKPYVDNLKAFTRLAERIRDAGKMKTPTLASNNSIIVQGLRSIFGPMDKIQRRITVANKVLRAEQTSSAGRALSNEKTLAEITRLPKMSPKRQLFWATLGGVMGPRLFQQLLADNPAYAQMYQEAQRYEQERKRNAQEVQGTAIQREEKRRGIRNAR
jgi:hypothetical protein